MYYTIKVETNDSFESLNKTEANDSFESLNKTEANPNPFSILPPTPIGFNFIKQLVYSTD